MRLRPGQRCLVAMVDGLGLDYVQASPLPTLKSLGREGVFVAGRAVYPSLTNANNLSIVCGAPPSEHGVTANCYLDEATGQARFLEDPSFLAAPTLFERVRARGEQCALLTCKAKTLGILGRHVAFGVAAQDPEAHVVARYGTPPDVYSREVNDWLWKVALDLLENRPELSVIYLHTTDYPMHRWAPEEPDSQAHLASLDSALAEMRRVAPDAALLLTADHGMNPKTTCLDLARILDRAGLPVRAAISPVSDRLVAHHQGHGGVSYLYLKDPGDLGRVQGFLQDLSGVDDVLPREAAASRHKLMPSRIGDLVVGADRDTVFGQLDDTEEILPPGYRNHGSRFELDIPLLAFNPDGILPDPALLRFNYDLTRLTFFQS
jgi:phosphonoacetate hydrolase